MPGIALWPLFAAGIDWLEGLLPLLFLLFWIVSQVVGVIRKIAGAGAAAKPAPRPPLPPRQQPDRGGQAGDVRVELERQIEEFLGRAQGGRQAKPIMARPDRPPAKPRVRANDAATQTPPAKQAARDAGRGGRQLGSLAAGDADVSRHVHDAFAHEIGHLAAPLAGGTAAEARLAGQMERPTIPATELAAALRSPATIRQIMLLKEVLDRPVDRW
jgi:hypothetical protein